MVTTDSRYHASEAAPGVTLVTGPGGRGMTCAPAIAEETFTRAGQPTPSGVPAPSGPPAAAATAEES
jgi:glycine/D-amino acid oxidase-like deaminating enzyme